MAKCIFYYKTTLASALKIVDCFICMSQTFQIGQGSLGLHLACSTKNSQTAAAAAEDIILVQP